MEYFFVHVGKCAGTSISFGLNSLKVPYKELHCGNADEEFAENAIRDDIHWIIAVRDPISRFVSAFYWDLYEKRISTNRPGPKGIWTTIYESFKTPNELAESLTTGSSEMKELAHAAFARSYLHMQFTLSWYIPISKAKFLEPGSCSVIRTESADADFLRFAETLSDAQWTKTLSREKSDYTEHIENYDKSLSDLALSNLFHIYRNDWRLLDYMYVRGLIDKPYETPV